MLPSESNAAELDLLNTFGERSWPVSRLFPAQGEWCEEEYLSLSTRRLVELSGGSVEVLPMPTERHQAIVAFLFEAFVAFVRPRTLGKVVFAPFRLRLGNGKFREPDLAIMLSEHADRRTNAFWNGADLVVEVVSKDDRHRDLVVKRREYAQAGISEYWIVDPQENRVTVLTLRDGSYVPHSEVQCSGCAVSALWPAFEVPVANLFAAE